MRHTHMSAEANFVGEVIARPLPLSARQTPTTFPRGLPMGDPQRHDAPGNEAAEIDPTVNQVLQIYIGEYLGH